MTATTNVTNVFLLVDLLPSSFREVHGRRPASFADHGQMSAWLDRMAAATLVSAENSLHLATTAAAADDTEEALKFAREGNRYMAAHEAIVALQVPA